LVGLPLYLIHVIRHRGNANEINMHGALPTPYKLE